MHRVGGELQFAAGEVDGDRLPQLLDASGRRVEKDEHGGPQRAGGSVEFRELPVAAVLGSRVAWESSTSVTWVARGTCRGTAPCPAARQTRAGCDRRGVARSTPGRARRSERTAQAARPTVPRRSGRSSPAGPGSGNRSARPRLPPGRAAPDHVSASRSTAGPPSAVIAGSGRGGRWRYKLVRGMPVFSMISAIVLPVSRR